MDPAIPLDLVDIHSHVLYGMDDGAHTLEDSLAMLRMAAEAGTTALVATPHASPAYKFNPEVIRERLAQVQAAAGVPVSLYTGCDFHLSYDNIQDAIAHPRKYTINQNRYLLVEFSDLLIFHNTAEIFQRLMDAGMTPVITHPERNQLLRQRIEEIAGWVDQGAHVQVTGQSLLGHFGKRALDFSEALLRRNLVHFIASDGHDLKHRPPRMDEAYAWLVDRFGAHTAQMLCVRNPRAALAGEGIRLPDLSMAPPAPKKWYQLWR